MNYILKTNSGDILVSYPRYWNLNIEHVGATTSNTLEVMRPLPLIYFTNRKWRSEVCSLLKGLLPISDPHLPGLVPCLSHHAVLLHSAVTLGITACKGPSMLPPAQPCFLGESCLLPVKSRMRVEGYVLLHPLEKTPCLVLGREKLVLSCRRDPEQGLI